ncbi:hypothetical protein KGY14_12230 [Ameyamaea chiangmaiensis]|uniref:Uncharacterized protein n=1 Tax=Ameyamaea chiangmaiensis TaxID=442969 RepID=A0A850PBS5_9PROT|nr:hypothetical protein [Ameyamaea chiangmaiensis]MBS4075958.1 hypothetical protein [Ameyamaea chiangmaiensis]NVN39756.1 hypothetical protein [Ameyamaea chiangmaiensis]
MNHDDRFPPKDDRDARTSVPHHTADADAHDVWTTAAVEWVSDAHEHF